MLEILVVFALSNPSIDPWDVPYHKQKPDFRVVAIGQKFRAVDSLECQKYALEYKPGLRVKAQDGVVAGAWCIVALPEKKK